MLPSQGQILQDMTKNPIEEIPLSMSGNSLEPPPKYSVITVGIVLWPYGYARAESIRQGTGSSQQTSETSLEMTSFYRHA